MATKRISGGTMTDPIKKIDPIQEAFEILAASPAAAAVMSPAAAKHGLFSKEHFAEAERNTRENLRRIDGMAAALRKLKLTDSEEERLALLVEIEDLNSGRR